MEKRENELGPESESLNLLDEVERDIHKWYDFQRNEMCKKHGADGKMLQEAEGLASQYLAIKQEQEAARVAKSRGLKPAGGGPRKLPSLSPFEQEVLDNFTKVWKMRDAVLDAKEGVK